MGFLWLAALVLVVIGFVVLGLGRRAAAGPLTGSLKSRGIDTRAWGADVLASGAMLSLGLWALTAAPWSGQTTVDRIVLLSGGTWAVVSLGRAVKPLVARRGGPPPPSLPVPGKGSRPPWLFLLLGWAIAIRLAWSALVRMG
jgi:hypothetical protein